MSPKNNGSCSYMKVIGAGQGHRSKKGRKFLFPQSETLSGHNSGFMKQSYEVCV